MNTRSAFLSLILLILLTGYDIPMAATVTGSGGDPMPSPAKITINGKVVDSDNKPELLPEKNRSAKATKQKKGSVKMIIGGQSEGGVAKQVILPVDD